MDSPKLPASDREAPTVTTADASAQASDAGQAPKGSGKKAKKPPKPLADYKVHEAGGVIVCGDRVVLRLTDKQHWIFPKGKLKKKETPRDAAIREATEETGLAVEVLSQVSDFLMRHEGKKRRFVFYVMRATGTTWDWQHHMGRDTFLIAPDKVRGLLHQKGYVRVWQSAEEHVFALCEEAARGRPDDTTQQVCEPQGEAAQDAAPTPAHT